MNSYQVFLDIGCGGGKNIKNLLEIVPSSKIYGIDYSAFSVEKSKILNKKAVKVGQVEIKEANVEALPFEQDYFECVTAFETIYFWKNILNSFQEVYRVLKKGGSFMICNEMQRIQGNEMWEKMLEMEIYTGNQIENLMQQAGFKDIHIDRHKNKKWLCVIGKK
ncbi:class I SAM-dependent methyltransferase [Anaerosacchariphilus polymeriproducens]|uniref:class I SAM-dependent methyltransferase n=1 Tax=Anaerosacchariphilus polymeriproducens TaxID=1812858 RepID=UPI0013903425|nr:class I SAM-dependent methyltransferase [Anaerosacchariphilus polymeriproducens]